MLMVCILDDDMLYCTDGDHGKKLHPKASHLEIGIPGEPAPFIAGNLFIVITHTALSPDNHIFVSDGYGNACV